MRSFQSSDCGAVVGDDGGVQCGSARPGPHQSSVEWYSFHRSQILRERSVSRFSRGKPMATANRSAPSPTSITWPVCSMTALATSETFLMLRTPPTDPTRRAGSMHAAGVEFYNPLFVRKTAESNGIVIRIIFRAFHNAQG